MTQQWGTHPQGEPCGRKASVRASDILIVSLELTGGPGCLTLVCSILWVEISASGKLPPWAEQGLAAFQLKQLCDFQPVHKLL